MTALAMNDAGLHTLALLDNETDPAVLKRVLDDFAAEESIPGGLLQNRNRFGDLL